LLFKIFREYKIIYIIRKFKIISKISVAGSLLDGLGLVYRNMYQMRHTFVSLMIASDEDILWVSSMLRHKNSSITLSVYAKYTKNTKKNRGTFLLAS